ncbi:ROK family protein [Bacillus methanolicus]|uniref:fructokinase n=1 Tax=Bacillus methanolicus (strain MGA3 / ATCC 53907) TaxID=796606 RepID=I3E7A6_BACMM|nr:ROK family protein [Bacillus methanolicus]AIE59208.1 Putative fructokinase [Bacillus methanolicus MGA3]EIJ82377.1 putative carbohydrate kinase [Bacillus methanolicus MGA3]UQD51280.1 ROK family protein [Bacillus methanolicus]
MLLGGIEAGGTKFVCAVGYGDGIILKRIEIPTTVPEETFEKVIGFFKEFELNAIGIGSFGPIDVNQESPTYGYITTTPKKAWDNFPFVQTIKEEFNVPIGFNTDVNAAALAESKLGAAKGLDSCLYITVGTGIGAGAIVQGKLLQGFSHPEMGHILVRRHPNDHYKGNCPYHQDCLEGLAAGPAIEERWNIKGEELQERQEVWDLEGFYLAQALMQYVLILSPKKIILGGGVMKQKQIFSYIYKYIQQLLNNYIVYPELSTSINDYIVPPGLKENAGIVGALLLAKQAYQEKKQAYKNLI